jgi:phosphatidylinositol-3-phosphatase
LRKAALAAIAAAGTIALGLSAAPAGAELEEPVSVFAEAPGTVTAGSPFRLEVEVKAEPGALDVAAQPLRLRVKAAPECGGSFAGSEGPTLLDRVLPAAAAGAAYDEKVSARAVLGQRGEETLCAFVEDDEERQFATDTEAVVTVIGPACKSSKRRLAKLHRRLHASGRKIATALRHGAPRKRVQALRKQRRSLRRQIRRAKRRAKHACAAPILATASAGGGGGALARAASAAKPPHIKHLFVIVLENENAENTFGKNPPAPYLGKKMREEGAFVPNYYGIGHQSLDNYIALVSGQPPNLATQSDCLLYTEMNALTTNEDGVAVGQGCVFPQSVQTVANQLEQSGQTWHGYMQDMANSVSAGEPATCRHPTLNSRDTTQAARPTDQYAARHDPFVYFHSIIDFETCQRNVVDLEALREDLKSEATTPDYSFITPDLCADGHDATCADLYSPGGFDGINAFLARWVPLIQASPAYRDHGAILVTFDESESGAESCCNEPMGPNTINNGGPQPGNGGGRVGAVVVSPCVRPGTVTQTPYNHYSTLHWVEDNFDLGYLGDAGANGLIGFGSDVFDRPECPADTRAAAKRETRTELRVRPRRAVAGRRRAFRFRLLADLPECRRGATVRFVGHRAHTNKRGIARIVGRPGGPGMHVAVARPPGCKMARTRIRVIARHS